MAGNFVNVEVDSRKARRGFSQIESRTTNFRPLLSQLGRLLRDNVRNRMNTEDGGNWAKPSKWTRAKKSQRKALPGQAKGINTMPDGNNRQKIFYEGASRTTGEPIRITDHHEGAILSADGSVVKLTLRAPSVLGVTKNEFYFRWLKNSAIPARKIWPTDQEAYAVVEAPTNQWLKQIVDGAF